MIVETLCTVSLGGVCADICLDLYWGHGSHSWKEGKLSISFFTLGQSTQVKFFKCNYKKNPGEEVSMWQMCITSLIHCVLERIIANCRNVYHNKHFTICVYVITRKLTLFLFCQFSWHAFSTVSFLKDSKCSHKTQVIIQ